MMGLFSKSKSVALVTALALLAACNTPPTPPAIMTPSQRAAATATSNPRPTSPPSPAQSDELRLEAAQADILKAQSLNDQEQWAQALPVWDQVIVQAPEYAKAYYERTRCYLHLMPSIRILEDYRDYAVRSLADMNRALELDPTNGDYYYERFTVHYNLAEIALYRADNDYWRELALADVQSAIAHGTRRTYVDRDVAYTLVDLRRYQEALDMFGQLPLVKGASLESDPGVQVGLAESFLGLEQLDKALQHIDFAIAASPGAYKQFDRALILYSLNRMDEALTQISASIDKSPCCFGPRYYLRALIYYRLGQIDLALADIDVGSGEAWERGGVRSYVPGLIALDSGQQEQATNLLLEAEASLPPRYSSTILKQIQQDLAGVGATPLVITPSAPMRLTPTSPGEILIRLRLTSNVPAAIIPGS